MSSPQPQSLTNHGVRSGTRGEAQTTHPAASPETDVLARAISGSLYAKELEAP